MDEAERDAAAKRRLQITIACGIVGLWGIGAILAAVDGDALLKATTPLVTMIFGWLFAAKATAV